MEKYKFSRYCFLIPVDERRVSLLFNALVNGLFELGENESIFIKHLIETGAFTLAEIDTPFLPIIETLIQANYIVPHDIDDLDTYKKAYTRYRLNHLDGSNFNITITPTLACNLACRYCFQNGAEHQTIKQETLDAIVQFVEARIQEKAATTLKNFALIWFGGEPLLVAKRLEAYSQPFQELCKRYGLTFHSEIVTNGTLLTSETWECLVKSGIKQAQITLDGPAETHNIRRLPKTQGDTYEKILTNLSQLPEDIRLSIRINCDRDIWEKIHTLLNDLEEYGIWPQHAKQVHIYLAFITCHDNARHQDSAWHFTPEEFYQISNAFTDIKLEHYNRWAKEHSVKLAKKRFHFPETTFGECLSAVNPNGFVFDTEGYIHKCWEEVDKPETGLIHVSAPYTHELKALRAWESYSRLNDPQCAECKYLPICDVHCTKAMLYDHKNHKCSTWKYNLEKEFKRQYIEKLDNPSLYADF